MGLQDFILTQFQDQFCQICPLLGRNLLLQKVDLRDEPLNSGQIVLLAFIGPRPFGHQGAHLNGQSKDNRLINLAYVTVSENAVHKKQHGTELNPSRKLGLSDVAEIRRMYATGGKQPAIAAKFGMSQQQISRIVNHRNWNYES